MQTVKMLEMASKGVNNWKATQLASVGQQSGQWRALSEQRIRETEDRLFDELERFRSVLECYEKEHQSALEHWSERAHPFLKDVFQDKLMEARRVHNRRVTFIQQHAP